VTVEMPGFRSATQSRMLGGGETLTFDFVLEVGVREEVTVTAM